MLKEIEINQQAKIAECAYYKAQLRGFIPGYELTDWLEAEQECEKKVRVNALKVIKKSKTS
ncbi:DUF2934 domain-containing protein [Methylomonas sp. AM2-LC]|uniref:DUF2934 domain-containing protein n=1 Tax=Methylomonas sp. AM2-LC TaxID=3153301 RepID=UPI003263E547